MYLFDTHTHLDAPQFDEDREEVIARAVEAGVSKMINIGFNRETIPSTMKLAESYDYIYAAVGWHPQDAIDMKEGDLDWIASLCSHEKVVVASERLGWIIIGIPLPRMCSRRSSANKLD